MRMVRISASCSRAKRSNKPHRSASTIARITSRSRPSTTGVPAVRLSQNLLGVESRWLSEFAGTAMIDAVPSFLGSLVTLISEPSWALVRHVIRFSYRPRDLRTGLIISMVTGVLLALLAFRTRRTRNASGFTLVELLIVMAIVGVLSALGVAGGNRDANTVEGHVELDLAEGALGLAGDFETTGQVAAQLNGLGRVAMLQGDFALAKERYVEAWSEPRSIASQLNYYRAAARRWHPDVGGQAKQFKALEQAKAVLAEAGLM